MPCSESRTDPWWVDCLFSAGCRVSHQRAVIETITSYIWLFMLANGMNRKSGVSFLLPSLSISVCRLSAVDYFNIPNIIKWILTFYGVWHPSEQVNPWTAAETSFLSKYWGFLINCKMTCICITPSVSIKAVPNDDMLVLKALTKMRGFFSFFFFFK